MVITEETLVWCGKIEFHRVNGKHVAVVDATTDELFSDPDGEDMLERLAQPLNEIIEELDAIAVEEKPVAGKEAA